MKERGILFSAPMVRALLDGSKTQTRRVVKQLEMRAGMPEPEYASLLRCCPYGVPGDRLWVREAWRYGKEFDAWKPREMPQAVGTWLEANGPPPPWMGKLRPSMFMPRWASRITLEITDVRVERLQDISEADAIAEGIDRHDVLTDGDSPPGFHAYTYRQLWERINGPGSWDANPWVWVVEFRRLVA